MKAKNYYSLGVTVLLGSTLLVGCVPSRVHHHSEYSSQSQDYHPYQQREYEERQPQEREQPRYQPQNRQYQEPQPQEHEQRHHNSPQHSRDDDWQQRQPQVEQSTEREPVRQRPQTRPQNNPRPEISAPTVQTQTVNKPSPVEIVTPEPAVVIKPPVTPPVQPCSRRIGCEDSKSTHTDSSRRER